MSRTIRRKGMKYPKYWRSTTREEFDSWKADYLSGDWRGIRTYTGWDGTVRTYQAHWYHREVTQHETYDAYVAYEEARFNSDNGYPVDNHQISASFRRCIERKYRAKRNHELRAAIVNGTEEELVLTLFVHNISWWY